MSLVRYGNDESKSVVLRHDRTLVLYDPQSRRIVLREAPSAGSPSIHNNHGLHDCPMCHRPFDHEASPGPEERRASSIPLSDSGFVDRNYFRMLDYSMAGQEGGRRGGAGSGRHIPRLKPEDTIESDSESFAEEDRRSPDGIKADAFSPGYFDRFFKQEKILGKGGKGVVLLVRHFLDGVDLGRFACKRVPVGDNHAWLKKVLIEVQLLQRLCHQNLVSYRHVWLENYQLTTFGPKVPCAFILQQYCNKGDLQNYVLGPDTTQTTPEMLKARLRRKSRGEPEIPSLTQRQLPFDQIISFFRDITAGLNHLHSNGFIHRDLKPSNCLLNENVHHGLTVLVSDFGEVQQENQTRSSTGTTGTISYCAPEVLTRVSPGGSYGNFTKESDVFSLGMILYFMCFSRLPYLGSDPRHEENEDLTALRAEISAWKGLTNTSELRSDLPDRLYSDLKTLISPDPSLRPSAEAILFGIGIGITNDVDVSPRRRSMSPSKSPGASTIPSATAPLPSNPYDTNALLSFQRISPVADTPPRSKSTSPVNGHSSSSSSSANPKIAKSDYGTTTRNGISKFKTAGKLSTSGHTRQRSLLSEEPITIDSLPPSPIAEDYAELPDAHRTSSSGSVILRPRLSTSSSPPIPVVTEPLLLPAPERTIWNMLLWSRARGTSTSELVGVQMTIKVALFLLKVAVMTQPCGSTAVKDEIFWPLMAMAGVDLVLPFLSTTLILAVVHFAIVETLRWRGGLCAY